MIVQFSESQISAAVDKAFRETTILMNGEFVKAITGAVYSWPVGESPRDAVDTGRLRASQQYQLIDARRANYTWSTEYASAVHSGYLLRNGKAMPARPWTDVALRAKNPTIVMNKLVNAYI
jgi:hypothetical protein